MSDREKMLRLALRGVRHDADMLTEPDPSLGVNAHGGECDCEECQVADQLDEELRSRIMAVLARARARRKEPEPDPSPSVQHDRRWAEFKRRRVLRRRRRDQAEAGYASGCECDCDVCYLGSLALELPPPSRADEETRQAEQLLERDLAPPPACGCREDTCVAAALAIFMDSRTDDETPRDRFIERMNNLWRRR